MWHKIAARLEELGVRIPDEFMVDLKCFYEAHRSQPNKAFKAIYAWSKDLEASHYYATDAHENLDETIPLFLTLQHVSNLCEIIDNLFQEDSTLREKCLQCNATSEINFNLGMENRCTQFFHPFLVESYLERAFAVE